MKMSFNTSQPNVVPKVDFLNIFDNKGTIPQTNLDMYLLSNENERLSQENQQLLEEKNRNDKVISTLTDHKQTNDHYRKVIESLEQQIQEKENIISQMNKELISIENSLNNLLTILKGTSINVLISDKE